MLPVQVQCMHESSTVLVLRIIEDHAGKHPDFNALHASTRIRTELYMHINHIGNIRYWY